MHVAIDDTYGPTAIEASRYMTGRRRTYVAVEFPDGDVDAVRESMRGCINDLPALMGVQATEFHFVDIYNRKGVWAGAEHGQNLALFEFFAQIYRQHRWKVHVQTIDDRTLSDHRLKIMGRFDGFDVTKRQGQALMFLLMKVKNSVPPFPEPLTVYIDEGERRPGAPFAQATFREWKELYRGRYASSADEPLLQVADFLAFSINRSTHLQLKPARTETDTWFLDLVGTMDIQSSDLKRFTVASNFTTADIDAFHSADRREKGLE